MTIPPENTIGHAILLYGTSGSGKTTKAKEYCQQCQQHGWKVGGILAPGLFQNGQRWSFDVYDLLTGQSEKLACRDYVSQVQIGPFGFYLQGLAFGLQAMNQAILASVDLFVIDEIGPLELAGQGWAEGLHKAAQAKMPRLLLTVRPRLLSSVQQQFLDGYQVKTWDAAQTWENM